MWRINYEVHGYQKFVIGDFIKEDEFMVYILARDKKEFRIAKESIIEMNEL